MYVLALFGTRIGRMESNGGLATSSGAMFGNAHVGILNVDVGACADTVCVNSTVRQRARARAINLFGSIGG